MSKTSLKNKFDKTIETVKIKCLPDQDDIIYSLKGKIDLNTINEIPELLTQTGSIYDLLDVFLRNKGIPLEITGEKNGRKEGIFQEFKTENNKTYVFRQTTYVANKKNGAFNIFNASGETTHESVFIDDQRDGLSRSYDDNGNVTNESLYKKGTREYIKFFNGNGSLKHHHQDGIFDKDYRSDGSLYSHTKFMTWTDVFKNEGMSHNAIGQTKSRISYDENGVKSHEINYTFQNKKNNSTNGKLQQEQTYYYPNGNIKAFANGFESNARIETYREDKTLHRSIVMNDWSITISTYQPDGIQIKSKKQYSNTFGNTKIPITDLCSSALPEMELNGDFTEFFENGALAKSGTWTGVGNWNVKSYNENKTLIADEHLKSEWIFVKRWSGRGEYENQELEQAPTHKYGLQKYYDEKTGDILRWEHWINDTIEISGTTQQELDEFNSPSNAKQLANTIEKDHTHITFG